MRGKFRNEFNRIVVCPKMVRTKYATVSGTVEQVSLRKRRMSEMVPRVHKMSCCDFQLSVDNHTVSNSW